MFGLDGQQHAGNPLTGISIATQKEDKTGYKYYSCSPDNKPEFFWNFYFWNYMHTFFFKLVGMKYWETGPAERSWDP